jgi:toxin HigB-1
MIKSFKCKETNKIWFGKFSRKFPATIQRIARRKLIHIDSAIDLLDLKVPPGNRLHLLSGNREGQHSISINEQWRICFIWQNANAYNVEIVDYH